MIAVDTNVLVRLLVGDDPGQAEKAKRLFDSAAAAGKRCWIADTVLVELAWTLSRTYGRSRSEIALALRMLARHGTALIESPEAVLRAIDDYEAGPADFADCLLCAKATLAGCSQVATFDRGMKALRPVKLL